MSGQCYACGAMMGPAARFCSHCGARGGAHVGRPAPAGGPGDATSAGPGDRIVYVVPPGRGDLVEVARAAAHDHHAELVEAEGPGPVQALLRRLDDAGQCARAVCLLGPAGLLRHASLEDPVGHDVALWTDNDYGMLSTPRDAERYSPLALPDVPVTRIPVDDPGLVARLLAVRDDLPPTWGKGIAVSSATWVEASAEVARRIAGGAGIEANASPPMLAADVAERLTGETARLYFNVHGHDQSSDWFGERDGAYTPALRAADIRVAPNAVLVSEACYGARHEEGPDSISLAFLAAGGSAFVGSTIVAWGPTRPPLSLADLIVVGTYEGLDAGLTLGAALLEAKARIAELGETAGRVSPQELNTISSFVAFGGPLASVAGAQRSATRKTLGSGTWAHSVQSTAGPGDVLGRVRAGLSQGGGGALGAARQRLAARAQRGGWRPIARETVAARALSGRYRTASSIQASLAEVLGQMPADLNTVTYMRGLQVETLILGSVVQGGFTRHAAVVVDQAGSVRARLVAKGGEGLA